MLVLLEFRAFVSHATSSHLCSSQDYWVSFNLKKWVSSHVPNLKDKWSLWEETGILVYHRESTEMLLLLCNWDGEMEHDAWALTIQKQDAAFVHVFSIKWTAGALRCSAHYSIIKNQVNEALLLSSLCFTLRELHHRNVTNGTAMFISTSVLFGYHFATSFLVHSFLACNFFFFFAYIAPAMYLRVQKTSLFCKF